MIERQLAHGDRDKVRASYNQGEYLEERRSMMQQWADLTDAMVKLNEDTDTDPRYIPFRPVARTVGFRSLQSTPIMSAYGEPLGILAIHFRLPHQPSEEDLRLLDLYVRLAADIIERHRADNALREATERLRLAQLKTGVGIWDWDVRTGQVTWTDQLAAIFGVQPDT